MRIYQLESTPAIVSLYLLSVTCLSAGAMEVASFRGSANEGYQAARSSWGLGRKSSRFTSKLTCG